MSTPYRRDANDPRLLVRFDDNLLNDATAAAIDGPRRRWITRFHEHSDLFQRMLNAIEPESYARPHRHLDPPRSEVFVILRGSALVVRFADDGTPAEGTVLQSGGPTYGVEIPVGAWHCLVSLEEGTVLFEAKEGPFEQMTAKTMAPWAPPEEDREAGLAYIAYLRDHFAAVLPAVSARNIVEAEDDEIL
jgi:cupin fold WbuC family metalloprotein